MSGTPIKLVEFEEVMRKLGLQPDRFSQDMPLNLAVSGGIDSLCLAYLALKWVKSPSHVRSLIVDHGLRPTSKSEAQQTAEFLKSQGSQTQILRWQAETPTTGIEEKARAARFSLFRQALGGPNQTLLLGHHQDDQIETFLLRLERKSGLKGLACMSTKSQSADQTTLHYRPLLSFPKERLGVTLNAAGWQAIEDETNTDIRFRRNWFRSHRPTFEEAGLAAKTLQPLVTDLGRLRTLVEQQSVAFIQNKCLTDRRGWGVLNVSEVKCKQPPVQTEILLRLMNWLARSEDERPSIENAFELLESGGSQGHVIFKRSGGQLWFYCCQRGSSKPSVRTFDKRFALGGFDQHAFTPAYVGQGRAQEHIGSVKEIAGIELPSYILANLPCLELQTNPNQIILPQFGYKSSSNYEETASHFGNLMKATPSESIFTVV